MKRQDYYPSQQSKQPEWLTKFATKLLERGAEIPLTTGIISAAVADALYLAYVIGSWLTEVRSFGPDCTGALKMVEHGSGADPFTLPGFNPPPLPAAVAPLPAVVAVAPGTLDRIVALVQEIKAKPGYTEELGLALGIVGPEDAPPGVPAGPEFSLKVEQGDASQVVKVRFKKIGHLGVAVYSRVAGGAWVLLGIATSSPYVDERALANPAQPEIREYKMRFWDDGSETGEWSVVDKVTVAP